MISVKNVSYTLREKSLLSHVSVSFPKNHIHGIVGNNGSGKTLLLKSISGYLKPTAGEIRIDGKRMYTDISFPPSMGLILETPGFLPYATGRQNLVSLASINKKPDRERIDQALETVGLLKERKKLFSQYSLGMRQRLGIAQAIMDKPSLYILDEPFNGLDNDGVILLRKLLLSLREEGATILLTSHNPQDIDLLCDTVHLMQDGVLTLVRGEKISETP